MSGLDQLQFRRVESWSDAQDFMSWLGESRPWLGCDTETSGLLLGHDKIRLVQFGDARMGWALDYPEWGGLVADVFRNYDGNCVWHNALFDLKMLKFDGVQTKQRFQHDTMVSCFLKDPGSRIDLKGAASLYVDSRARVGQTVLKDFMAAGGFSWGSVPRDADAYWCVPETTEILTRTGWKTHSDLLEGDETLGYDGGVLRWTPIFSKQTFNDAPLVTLGNKDWSIACTPQHRWLIEQGGEVQLRALDEAWKRNDRDMPHLILSASYVGGNAPITSDEAAVMAWLLSDGHISWRRPKTQTSPIAQISQSVDKYADEIRELLVRAGAYISERTRPACNENSNDIVVFYVSAPYVQRLWDRVFRDRSLTEVVLDMPREALDSWLDAWRKAEGTAKGGLHYLSQNEGEKCDALVLSAYLSGFFVSTSTKEVGHLGIRLRKRVPTPQKTRIADNGRGSVWCPITGLGSWTARDGNGNVFVTGNTYGVLDTCLTAMLAEALWSDTGGGPLREAYELNMAVIHILRDAEITGLRVDEPYRAAAEAKLREEIGGLEAEIPFTPSKDRQALEYLLSIGAEITERTESGNLSVDKFVLGRLMREDPDRFRVAGLLNTWRQKARNLGTYIETMADVSRGGMTVNGVLRAHAHPVGGIDDSGKNRGTRTGRLSVTDPALQTLPKGRIVRDAIIAREGCHILQADYSGMELRALASMAGEVGMLEAFERGEDLHEFVAAKIFGPGFTKPQRGIAKNTSFCKAYGGGPAKIAETAGVPLSEAETFVAMYEETFPALTSFMQSVVNDIMNQAGSRRGRGWVTLPDGTRLPVKGDEAYKGVNYKIQGGTAVAAKRKLVELDAAGLGEFFRLAIHDEMLWEVPVEHCEEAKNVIAEVMPDSRTYHGVTLEISQDELDRWGQHYRHDGYAKYIETSDPEWLN